MQALMSFGQMITGANPNAVIAVLTGVIAGTTVVYTLVTWRLLRQSRSTFLVDTVIRIAHHTQEREERYLHEIMGELSNMMLELGATGVEGREKRKMHWERLRAEMETEPYRVGLSEAIGDINKKLGVDLSEVLDTYIKKSREVQKEKLSKIERFRDGLKSLYDEIVKQALKDTSEGV